MKTIITVLLLTFVIFGHHVHGKVHQEAVCTAYADGFVSGTKQTLESTTKHISAATNYDKLRSFIFGQCMKGSKKTMQELYEEGALK